MKYYLLLALCAITATALPIEELEEQRVSGENGWYVPQMDGSLKWLNTAEGEAEVARFQEIEDLTARVSLNGVNFYLYTQSNPDKGQKIELTRKSIDASNFNAENPTRFTIHGWNSNYKDGVNTGVRRAWFKQGDYNMIAVDWTRGRSLEYASSVAGAPGAGKRIATLIDFLVTEYGLSLKTLEVVGFSLGAHVAGFTAKQVETGRVGKVVGLDPAGPLLSYNKPEKRLAHNDADYVESIQTNGGTLGFIQPIGRAAFFPNGGKHQPGCGVDVGGGCAHQRAVMYYVESLERDNFPTMKCDSYVDAHNTNCGATYSSIRMGSAVNSFVANGDFYVPVNSESPFGKGVPEDDKETTTSKNVYIITIIFAAVKVTTQ